MAISPGLYSSPSQNVSSSYMTSYAPHIDFYVPFWKTKQNKTISVQNDVNLEEDGIKN